MEDRRPKRAKFTEASSPTMSKRRRGEKLVGLQSEQRESESPLLPSSDWSEKIILPLASASSTSGNNYHVFLSFRGPDTRNGFVDHLYHKLQHMGLPFHPNFVFRDNNDLPFGEKIGENLISAIKHSKVSIPVISKNYAASEWCLRELIQIMECVERGEQKVLPVLYKVKPKHVRKLNGAFGKAFRSSMHLFEEDVKQQGPEALRKAVACRIFESKKFASGREGELVNELVGIVMQERQRDFQPPLPVNLVGIDDHVAEVMRLVDTASSETRIVGIYGIDGVGKTTLATLIFKELFEEFECCSFLKDTRETIHKKGIEYVQSLLISDITKSYVWSVRDSNMGIGMIRSVCEKRKALILLDDVDCQDHLDNLIGGCNFKSGSRIIITTRDKALLKSEYCYELKEMNSKDSLILFSRHAFEEEQSPKDLMALSSDIVSTTGGLPLSLQVIGSFLKGKNKSIWTDTLEKLKEVPHVDVQTKLRISYDSLEYREQQIFLDIACFFIGIDKRIATYMWRDLQLHPNSALARMSELSLIKVDDNNVLRMHNQLRDLGKALASPADKMPCNRSRLWGKEAMKALRCKEENENIKALCLDERGTREFMERGSFKRMPALEYLQLSNGVFVGDFEGSLSELRWLSWKGCPDSFEAINFHLENLVTLDLSFGNINENWRGWSSIEVRRLKVLDLSWSPHYKSTPNLSMFKSLEMLILEGCGQLEEIDPSIGDARCLVSLKLRYCVSLKKLPPQLGELKDLAFLDLWECVKLQELPEEIGKLQALKELIIGGTAIKKIPSCIGSLKKLEIVNVCHCKSLVEVPDSISHLAIL